MNIDQEKDAQEGPTLKIDLEVHPSKEKVPENQEVQATEKEEEEIQEAQVTVEENAESAQQVVIKKEKKKGQENHHHLLQKNLKKKLVEEEELEAEAQPEALGNKSINLILYNTCIFHESNKKLTTG